MTDIVRDRIYDPNGGHFKERKISRRNLGKLVRDTVGYGALGGLVGTGIGTVGEAFGSHTRSLEAERYKPQGYFVGDIVFDLDAADFRSSPNIGEAIKANLVARNNILKMFGKDVQKAKQIKIKNVPYVEFSNREGRFGERSIWFVISDTEKAGVFADAQREFTLFTSESPNAVVPDREHGGKFVTNEEFKKLGIPPDQIGIVTIIS